VKRAELTSAMHRKYPREEAAVSRGVGGRSHNLAYGDQRHVRARGSRRVRANQASGAVRCHAKADLDQFATQSETYTAAPETGEVSTFARWRRCRTERGRAGFAEWWNSPEIKPLQKHLRQNLSRWEILAKAADERGGATPAPEPDPTTDEDPFGLSDTESAEPARDPALF